MESNGKAISPLQDQQRAMASSKSYCRHQGCMVSSVGIFSGVYTGFCVRDGLPFHMVVMLQGTSEVT